MVGVAALEVALAGEAGAAVEAPPVVEHEQPARLPLVEEGAGRVVEDGAEAVVGLDHVVDEAALEDARRSLQRPTAQLPSETQELAAAGKVVAMEIDDEAREAIDTLITENTESKPGVLQRLGRRLQGKLASAQHRRSTRSRDSEKTA